MNKIKLFMAPLLVAIALFLSASVCYAQMPQLAAAGSSAVFVQMAVAAATGDPITQSAARCGSHIWTSKSGSTNSNIAAAIDPRPGIPAEPGNILIIWDNTATQTTVCFYISVDTIVGDRMLYAAATGPAYATLSLNNNLSKLNNCNAAVTGDSAIPYFTDTDPLPTNICTIVQGATITAAFSDIRAEDAEFMNYRATTLGWAFGQAVQSAFTTTSAQIQDFYINGKDPNTGIAVRPTESIDIGAQAMMMIVNTGTGTANPGDFGNLFPSGGNVNSRTIDLVFSPAGNGIQLNHTVDVAGVRGIAGQPLNIAYREPTSGTYNVFEFQMPHEKGSDGSQEASFPSTATGCFPVPGVDAFPIAGGVNCHNPSYQTQGGATRARVIGTGEMIKVVNASHNGMGYAFWSFSNFRNQANVKYLTLDGVDPLGPAGGYTGNPPQCTGTINANNLVCPALSLANVANGSYRNWNVIRLLTVTAAVDGPRNAFAKAFVQEIQDVAKNTINDFVPAQFCSVPNLTTHTCTTFADGLHVFRSHYALPAVNSDPTAGPWLPGNPTIPINGTPISLALNESGGDVAGAIFNDQSDVDFFTDSGSTAVLTGYIQ